ncbi:unnamed protein product [Urochloa decumbens]|uniref:Cytochrome P450 n=1 Tax=Urochloa decumbens TaxID=240449 RepID=A0ABC9B6U0_9POAL
MRNLASRHYRGNGLMLLRLGTVQNLVVSTPRAAQAVLRTHDHVFASRPPSTLVNDLQYGPSSNFGAAPYGEHWRQVRKLATTHLLAFKKVNSYHLARQEEVCLGLAKLRQAAAMNMEVDISEMVNTFTDDIVCRTVSSKFFRAGGRNKLFQIRELIEVNSTLSARIILESYYPSLAILLGLFAWFLGNKAADTHKRWDELLENMICDHERRSFNHWGESDEQEQSANFIDVMLCVQQEYGITRDSIKDNLL